MKATYNMDQELISRGKRINIARGKNFSGAIAMAPTDFKSMS